ncbi:MAG: carboxypeptidase-like regulatory domain-containing protein [Paludibaculum sp.]
MQKRISSHAILLIGLSLAASSAAFAQTGQITGRVADASGAVVAGASVKVKNAGTNVERSTVSNESGLYTVPLLGPGRYHVAAEKPGFKLATLANVDLAVDQRLEVNFTLEIGSVSEKIDVVEQSQQLNTVEASQGQVIDNKRIVEMPLNGRYYGDLALLSTGAVPSAPGSRFGGFSSGGQRVTENNYLIDGIDNNSVELAGAGRRSEMVQPPSMRCRSSRSRRMRILRNSGERWARSST